MCTCMYYVYVSILIHGIYVHVLYKFIYMYCTWLVYDIPHFYISIKLCLSRYYWDGVCADNNSNSHLPRKADQDLHCRHTGGSQVSHHCSQSVTYKYTTHTYMYMYMYIQSESLYNKQCIHVSIYMYIQCTCIPIHVQCLYTTFQDIHVHVQCIHYSLNYTCSRLSTSGSIHDATYTMYMYMAKCHGIIE